MISSTLLERVGRLRLVVFDFDGVFTDNAVYVSQDGSEMVRCFRGDGIGLRKLDRLGIHSAILSSESNPVVTARSRKLQIRCLQGCENKEVSLRALLEELGVGWEETAFVGNDLNDRGCLALVGLPIVVQDAHPDVLGEALYRTATRGGYGAVREVCDLIERLRDPARGEGSPASQSTPSEYQPL
jgi:YrbI family 3-deoxy-D-manno-octulosonate 8-phosphate phosphatase